MENIGWISCASESDEKGTITMLNIVRVAATAGAAVLFLAVPALAQESASKTVPQQACAWEHRMTAQEATASGNLTVELLNDMSALVAAEGYTFNDQVQKVCGGYLMGIRRSDGSPGLAFVDPKTRTLVEVEHD